MLSPKSTCTQLLQCHYRPIKVMRRDRVVFKITKSTFMFLNIFKISKDQFKIYQFQVKLLTITIQPLVTPLCINTSRLWIPSHMKGRTIYFIRVDPYCNLRLLLSLFVCSCVVIVRNKNILKRKRNLVICQITYLVKMSNKKTKQL